MNRSAFSALILVAAGTTTVSAWADPVSTANTGGSSMTRAEFIAKEAAEKAAMAAKDYVWNHQFAKWDYVGPQPEPRVPSITRAEFIAKEAAEKANMAAKGYVWNHQFAKWDYVGRQPQPSAGTLTREQFVANESAEARAMAAKGFVWDRQYGHWDAKR
jgi:hypothetical protein